MRLDIRVTAPPGLTCVETHKQFLSPVLHCVPFFILSPHKGETPERVDTISVDRIETKKINQNQSSNLERLKSKTYKRQKLLKCLL